MFSEKTIQFLKQLAKNNNRDWFMQNKEGYEELVRKPALEFIASMEPALMCASPYFEANTKKVGGSLMRVHRDIRFGKDKSPYKTNIGIHFRHVRAKDVHAPGYYLHIEPDNVFLGAGIWQPDGQTLLSVRTLIAEHPAEWKVIRKKILSGKKLEFSGSSLKRAPKGFDPEHELIEDLRRKDFIAIRQLSQSDVYRKGLKKKVENFFNKSTPLMSFICEANDLMF